MEAPQIIDVPSLGIAIRAVGAGAYVTEVRENSAGTRAGLKPGMVLTQVNGVALGGAGTAMAVMLGGDAAELALGTAAGDHIVVKRTRGEK